MFFFLIPVESGGSFRGGFLFCVRLLSLLFCTYVTFVRFSRISKPVTRGWDVVLVIVLNSLSDVLEVVFLVFPSIAVEAW